ncbi:APC family permease [Francisellaceae bacterium]|nr:APC family permease [Francisellaceae bacterium]
MSQFEGKPLNTYKLTLMNVTAIINLSSIAYMATIGFQSVVFYLIAGLFFLVPTALVCAELGGMMTQDNGGVYSWVSRAFGKKAGIVAIWMEWFNNVIGFPASLSAIVATIAYIGLNGLLTEKIQMWVLMLVIYWVVTFFNFLPMKRIVWLNILGALFGMILPGILILIGAIYAVSNGEFNHSVFEFDAWVPTLSFATFALLVKTFSSYSGIQATAFHMRNVENPQRKIPISMLNSILVIFLLTSISTVALALILPEGTVDPLNGLIQGISLALSIAGLSFLKPVIALLITLGMVSALSTWMLGPARAMQEAAHQDYIPKVFSKINKNSMPIAVLLIQGIIGTLLSFVFLFMPSIQSAFAMLVALTSQFTVFVWIMVFASAIKLRYIQPDAHRVFRVGIQGNAKLISVCVIGIFACGCGFFLGLFPPGFSHIQSISTYIIAMIVADIIIISIPLIWLYFHRHNN